MQTFGVPEVPSSGCIDFNKEDHLHSKDKLRNVTQRDTLGLFTKRVDDVVCVSE